MRRLREWPYWHPVRGGTLGWLAAFRLDRVAAGAAVLGITRRNPQPHKSR